MIHRYAVGATCGRPSTISAKLHLRATAGRPYGNYDELTDSADRERILMNNPVNCYPRPYTQLEESLGYRFTNPSYLQKALTHSSYSNEQGDKHHHLLCNERLEFLGDSVLSLVVSRYLYSAYSDLAEGDLTRMRAELVCERALSSFADEIRHFVDCTQGKAVCKSPAEDGVELMKILRAIYKSAETGHEVVIG